MSAVFTPTARIRMSLFKSFWNLLSPHTKIVGRLCIAQAACLLLGLWIRDRFVTAVAASAMGSMDSMSPLLHAMTFVWICGMQSAVCWFILQRSLKAQHEHIRDQRAVSLSAARELVRTRDAVIFGLAKLSESRDPETGRHLERISLYSTKLASALRNYPQFRQIITPEFIRTIGVSSVLHDIGKVGVSDSVLLKPGKLTAAERSHIQTHARLGADCIREIEGQLGDSEFLKMAKEIALSHHEWWDGTGYPQGICQEEIPLTARIVAIADVYDALSTHRPYKDAFPHEECVEYICDGAGTHFDPFLVQVFMQIEGDFRLIARRFAANSANRGRLTRAEEEILTDILEDAEQQSAAECVVG